MYSDNEQPESRWKFLFSWPSLMMLGLLAYELTSEASLGVAILCLKFGMEDFLTALWLRRKDPDATRARTSFWLFLSWGFWKSAAAGAVMMIVVGVVAALTAGNGAQPPFQRGAPSIHLIMAVMTAVWALFACALTAGWAVIRGLFYGQKLWLNPAVHFARRNGLWPLPRECLGYQNKAIGLTMTAWFIWVFAGGSVCFVLIGAFLFGAIAVAGWLGVALPLLYVIAITLIAAAYLAGLDFLKSKVLARNPHECWPVDGEDCCHGLRTTDYGP